MSVKRNTALYLWPIVVLISGCMQIGDENLFDLYDQEAPRLLATLPAAGWIQVPRGIRIKIWFSEPIAPETVDSQSISLQSGSQSVTASFLVSVDDQGLGLVELQPWLPLIGGVRYRLQVTEQVTDLLGNPLAQSQEIQFHTTR